MIEKLIPEVGWPPRDSADSDARPAESVREGGSKGRKESANEGGDVIGAELGSVKHYKNII